EYFAQRWLPAWPAMNGCLERVYRGVAARLDDQQASATFSFVPVRDELGAIGGAIVTLLEPTATSLRDELARTKADLEQYGRMIAHDFRSPMRTIEQMAKIVLDDNAEQLPPRAASLLNHVVSGASKLAMRADLVSRIESLSRHSLSRQTVDVTALARKTFDEVRVAEPDREVEFIIGDLPAADADFDLLRLILNSLLSNALKFTRKVEHARIEVNGWREGDQLIYSIKDNGAGFDPKYAGRLFGFFQRMHSEEEFEGLGMGLAMARRLIERHGGTIRAEAQKNHGAEFRFTLPV
ncbi:MAG: ATP-binding protein, partial [Steroidobacter sp.]